MRERERERESERERVGEIESLKSRVREGEEGIIRFYEISGRAKFLKKGGVSGKVKIIEFGEMDFKKVQIFFVFFTFMFSFFIFLFLFLSKI